MESISNQSWWRGKHQILGIKTGSKHAQLPLSFDVLALADILIAVPLKSSSIQPHWRYQPGHDLFLVIIHRENFPAHAHGRDYSQ